LRVEATRLAFSRSAILAQEYLLDLERVTSPNGWCLDLLYSPTKAGGYIQLSWGGANKFCTVGELLVWASGNQVPDQSQVSHLCHNPRCLVPDHVVVESPKENNGRKGCRVWIDCPHCPRKIFLCTHSPACVKAAPGWASEKDFVDNALHY
jgi:hypothetical protein